MGKSKFGVIGAFIGVIALTVIFSLFITSTFRVSEVKEEFPKQLIISESMTISQIAETNKIKTSSLREALGIQEDRDLSKTISELGIEENVARDRITKKMNLEAEAVSKNFALIIAKFILWILFMLLAFIFLRKGTVSDRFRNYMLLAAVIIFGVFLGSDPNSMSTITDMVSAYAIKGIIFPPRIVGLSVFLLFVFLANKIICGWACHFGALQDFIFRLNRDSNGNKGVFKQFKVPFAISNIIRMVFFGTFILAAFLWSANIVEIINPFNIFDPGKLSIIGIVFISAVLVSSLFIYRPWCHFFCPFGLVGWVVEKFSRYKIKSRL